MGDVEANQSAAAVKPKKKRKKKPLMPDPPVTLERVPAILEQYNWMRASRTPRERLVMKALLVVWDAYVRLGPLNGEPDKKWAGRVTKP